MSIRFYADEFRCAIYEEAPGGGDPVDPNSQMNRPVLAPLSWLPNVYFHSNLDYYGVVASNLSISVTHPIIPVKVNNVGLTGFSTPVVQIYGNIVTSDHLLLTHNLGYVPKFFAIYNGRFIPNGIPVQSVGSSRARFASVYATSTQIRVYTVGFSDTSELPVVAVNYGVMVFRDSAPISGEQMLKIEPSEVIFGQGKFKSSQPHLRVVGPGDAQYPVATSRTANIRNAGIIAYFPGGGSVTFGPYNGSMPAPSFINVTAGV